MHNQMSQVGECAGNIYGEQLFGGKSAFAPLAFGSTVFEICATQLDPGFVTIGGILAAQAVDTSCCNVPQSYSRNLACVRLKEFMNFNSEWSIYLVSS